MKLSWRLNKFNVIFKISSAVDVFIAQTDAEKIIAPAVNIVVVETILGTEATEKIKRVPFSNNTISRRIVDLSSDLKKQIREHFEASENEFLKLWSLQVDECQLLANIRFIKDNKFVNEFLLCHELKTRTKGEDIFNVINDNISLFNLTWKSCVSVFTDGCPSMTGNKVGFVTLVERENPDIVTTHCMILRESLAPKTLPVNLQPVLNQAIKVVNFIKCRPLNSRIFTQLSDAMDSDYKCLLYHTEVRWLSRAKVLKRLVHLKVEVISFLETENHDFDFLHDKIWWLQGPSENVITSTSKLKTFEEKLTFWKGKILNGIFESFPTVNES